MEAVYPGNTYTFLYSVKQKYLFMIYSVVFPSLGTVEPSQKEKETLLSLPHITLTSNSTK
jgi:hypothetical protein